MTQTIYYIELERHGLKRDYSVIAGRRREAVEYAASEYLKENGMKPRLRRVECEDYTVER